MSISKRPPEVIIEKASDYRTIIVSAVFGGHRPGCFEIIIYTDETIADDALSSIPPDPTRIKVKRILQCRLVMDPFQAKSFMLWLKKHIEDYEKEFGEIKLPKKMEKGEPTYIK